ncbi:hypothetical protein LguiA_036489 [Lonicera macranthoides]
MKISLLISLVLSPSSSTLPASCLSTSLQLKSLPAATPHHLTPAKMNYSKT